MQFLRKAFFYIFLILYLISCPLLILYAFGYIFNPKSLELVQTGLMYLSSIPVQATVYIGKSRFREKTPAVLRELIPGNYSLKLILKDYLPWEQEVSIAAGKTLGFENVLLIPKNWKIQELTQESFKEILFIPESDFLLLSGGPKMKDYSLYNLKDEKLLRLIPQYSHLANARVLSRFISKTSSGLIFHIEVQGVKKFIWLEPKEKKTKIKDITRLFPEAPLSLEWEANEKKYIFSIEKDAVNRIDIASMAIFPEYLEGLRGFGIDNKQIYSIDNDCTLSRLNYDKTNKETLYNNVFDDTLFAKNDFVQIKVFSKNIIVLLDKRGDCMVRYLAHSFRDKGILGCEFDPATKKLLLWKKNAIGIFDFSNQQQESETARSELTPVWVYTAGENITECFWAVKGTHIIFGDKEGAYLLEPESYGASHSAFIALPKRDSPIFYSEITGCLYYLDAQTSKLTSVELVPRSYLELLLFPKTNKEASNGNKK